MFSRDYYYCRKCKIGFCPSDKELEIIPRKLQFDIQWRILEMIVKHPFEEACKEIEKHYNVKVQKKTAHELIQTVAKGLTFENAIKSANEIKENLIQLRKGSRKRLVVVIGIDGAHVPIRPEHESSKGKRGKGYWREAKGIRVYAIAEKRIHNILSWHQIQSTDQLEDSLSKILESNYIPSDVARICVCADGANWIWNRVKKVFPGEKLVLDYYHCSEHLHQFANIFFGSVRVSTT